MMSVLLTLITAMWVTLFAVLNVTSGQSSQSGVYISLKGVDYPNNSVILITEIEQTNTTSNNGLQCITDKRDCCATERTGDWFFPDGSLVPTLNDARIRSLSFYRNRGYDPGTVNLNRLNNNVTMPTGKFCCVVPDATNTNVALYANIVNDSTSVQVAVKFNLTSQDSPVVTFSLTCNSTGGPVHSVTWTRDGLLLENTGLLEQTNSTTASYTNILQVSGRTPGTYTCQMRGMDNQVLGAMDFSVYAAAPPLNVRATQTSDSDPVEVSWSQPPLTLGTAAITSYRVFYGEGESILLPSYVTRILLNFIKTQDNRGQTVSIRSESMELPSELKEIPGVSMVSSLSCSTQVWGTAVGVILLLVGLLAIAMVSTLILAFRKRSIPSKKDNEFSRAANIAYDDGKLGGEGDLYEDPDYK